MGAPHPEPAFRKKTDDLMTFKELGLDDRVLRAIDEAGYSEPTPIQAQAIPHVILGGDVTGVAQTGTGKTAAFVLPMIHRLSKGRARARMPRSLILAPTRELAAQVSESFETYGRYLKLTKALLIGGVSFKDQEALLMRGVDVLIATPGRLLDQFERGKILLTAVETLIIDEADRMLDMGFMPDIEKILGLLPVKRQTLLFSATMPPEITKLAERFQSLPKRIEVTRPAKTAETITQHVVKLPSDDDRQRRHALRAVIQACQVKNAIVFCNRKREVDLVTKSLTRHGFDAAAIHGDLPQAYRTETLNRFRDGSLTLLVASDVAARGLDIPEVSHVFNFGPPPKDEDYVHRIGRTGRAGRTGESYTLVAPGDEKSWAGVLKMIRSDVAEFMPDGLLDALAEVEPERGGRSASRSRSGSGSRSRPGRTEGGRSAGRSEARSQARSEDAESAPPPAKRNETDTGERSRPTRSRSRRGRGSEDDTPLPPAPERIVGFGDDVPDFLKR